MSTLTVSDIALDTSNPAQRLRRIGTGWKWTVTGNSAPASNKRRSCIGNRCGSRSCRRRGAPTGEK